VFNGRLLVMGGFDFGGIGFTRKVYQSTDSGLTWTEVGTNVLPHAFSDGASVVSDGKVWLFGGVGDGATGSRRVLWSADIVHWFEAGTDALPFGWTNMAAATYSGALVLCGGYQDSAVIIQSAYQSVDGGVTWTEVGTNSLPHPLYAAAAVNTNDGAILLLGGDSLAGPWADVYASRDGGLTWRAIDALPQAVNYAAAAVRDGAQVLLAGGYGGPSYTPLNTAYSLTTQTWPIALTARYDADPLALVAEAL
jgi:hypothetical protein